MPLELDGKEVLRILIGAPEVFPASHDDLTRVAQSLVVKQLRQRSLGLEGLKAVAAALGHDNFLLVADAMSDQEIKSLALRMDPHHDSLRIAVPSWVRGHLLQLAEGDVEPEAKASGPGKKNRPAPATRTMSSRAMAAVAKPRDDAPPKPKGKTPTGKTPPGKTPPGKTKDKEKPKSKAKKALKKKGKG